MRLHACTGLFESMCKAYHICAYIYSSSWFGRMLPKKVNLVQVGDFPFLSFSQTSNTSFPFFTRTTESLETTSSWNEYQKAWWQDKTYQSVVSSTCSIHAWCSRTNTAVGSLIDCWLRAGGIPCFFPRSARAYCLLASANREPCFFLPWTTPDTLSLEPSVLPFVIQFKGTLIYDVSLSISNKRIVCIE